MDIKQLLEKARELDGLLAQCEKLVIRTISIVEWLLILMGLLFK